MTIKELLSEYGGVIPPQLENGVIEAAKINSATRTMNLTVRFEQTVPRQLLFDVENIIKELPMGLNGAFIKPIFPQGSFSPDYYPELVKELKRRNQSLNGSLNDSTVTLGEDGSLTVMLCHGGAAILKAKSFD